jgi:transposase
MTTRIIGIDLAVEAAHKAVVLDQASNEFVSGLMPFHTDPAEIDRVVQAARAHTTEGLRLVAVLEATAMSWFTVGTYLLNQGVQVYRVHGRQTADQRKVYQRHAKSDRIDARVLARLYLTCPERLTPLYLPSGAQMELQRLCRELARLVSQSTAIKNRLLAIDGYAWLGLRDILPPYGPAARWLRSHWYSPWRVLQAGIEPITQAWKADNPDAPGPLDWIPALAQKAQRVTALYKDPLRVDYEHLQASLAREQDRLQQLEVQQRHLRIKVLRPLYRKLHPQRYLETLPGVAQDSAAVYIAFVGDIRRFPSLCRFRGWSGLVPASSQSGEAQAKGLHITQAGPDLVKSTAFLNAGVSRLYDPQIAAIYYDQMMTKGKHHLQAICACATHLLNRIYAVLHQNRPYQLRDVDGTSVSKRLARAICTQRYQVPEDVRRHNNYRVRRAWAEQRLEQRRRRELRKRRSKG